MGSEMCIRDRLTYSPRNADEANVRAAVRGTAAAAERNAVVGRTNERIDMVSSGVRRTTYASLLSSRRRRFYAPVIGASIYLHVS